MTKQKIETVRELIYLSYSNLAMAHTADNLIFACRICNSSKGKKDLMEWMNFRGQFLPLMIIRRYLKLTFNFCSVNGLLDKEIEDLKEFDLPFKIDLLPIQYPDPIELVLNIEGKVNG